MDDKLEDRKILLGNYITVKDLVDISRNGLAVEFSESYCNRVRKARNAVEKWVEEGRVMYGITTGFGALSTTVIEKDEVQKLQRNILLSHATAVGRPLNKEAVRAIMVAMLQNMGSGFAGVRLQLLERIKDYLNMDIVPYAPGDGSVGYLSVEAHIGLTIIGLGKVYYKGELKDTAELLKDLGMEPISLAEKEGLSIISGTSSPTAFAALAIYDIHKALKTADIIAAMNIEVAKGTVKAFDERLMKAKPYKEQMDAADNIREILRDCEIVESNMNYRLQDALSLRAVPQLHGAARRTVEQSLKTVEEELNYCADNPIIWTEDGVNEALSGCHCDSSYVGLAMDSASIAATMTAKASERRNYRLLTGHFSEYPWFLIKNPGVNSGLMIPQYTQAGLLNEMRVLSHPAVTDNTPTCGGQEDYVAMGYFAAKKSMDIAEKFEYVIAIELLSVFQAYEFTDKNFKRSSVSDVIVKKINETVPFLNEDEFLSPYIEYLKKFIHEGSVIELAESVIDRIK